jgi:predicted DNA repair protein MutK
MNIGVYGLVAGIVKLDDLGLALHGRESAVPRKIGLGIITASPYLMKALGVVGTAAMFLVGGGILVHGIPPLEHVLHDISSASGWAEGLVSTALSGTVGVLAGGIIVAVVSVVARATKPKEA